ncbi:hypothetical protein [Komagataeibacter oboediens]|uniref:hypothetical protein n=1 Tax=Komagataeibacter oboediens TaxID=65958 RepID=UPI001C2D48BB|nr:hypothetical protein [Komagataeibacter oboediens]MBV1825943.1 hypothetical protein [Komagataeibacter oboediens]
MDILISLEDFKKIQEAQRALCFVWIQISDHPITTYGILPGATEMKIVYDEKLFKFINFLGIKYKIIGEEA